MQTDTNDEPIIHPEAYNFFFDSIGNTFFNKVLDLK